MTEEDKNLRDFAAIMAMQGMYTNGNYKFEWAENNNEKAVAEAAYTAACAFMIERERVLKNDVS